MLNTNAGLRGKEREEQVVAVGDQGD